MDIIKHGDIQVDKLELGFGKSINAHKFSFVLSVPFYYMGSYDIIHVLNGIPFTPPLRKKNAKTVTTVNEFIVLNKNHPFIKAEKKQKRTLMNRIESLIGMAIKRQQLHSDYLIVISEKTLKEALQLGYSREKIFIVNLGIDERFLVPIKKKKHNKFKVGFIGGFNVRKNAIFAIRAFKQIKEQNIVFELWGKKTGEYENLVKEAENDNRIKFMGFAPEEKLVDIYESFDAFVYPSMYAGLELELLEAQARGVPVIMYSRGDVTKEAKYYFGAESEKDMARIITDLKKKGFNSVVRKKAIKYARTFTWKKTTEKTLDVYRKIADLNR